MVALAHLDTMHVARELIRARMRLSIVCALTDVGVRTLRRWWRGIHGSSPKNGKLPETVLSFITNMDDAALVSAYAALYIRLHGRKISAANLLTTWREFQDICGPLDVNAAYYSIRDIKAGLVVLAQCGSCTASFIYDGGSRLTDRCPFCLTKPV